MKFVRWNTTVSKHRIVKWHCEDPSTPIRRTLCGRDIPRIQLDELVDDVFPDDHCSRCKRAAG